jgi:hypothetical protein
LALHGRRYESQLIKNADVVVTNSLYYTEYAREFNPNSHMVGQGAMFHSLILNYEIIPEKELTPIKTLLLDMLDT